MFERYRIIHFVGMGGIGMSGIAEVLHNLGYEVTGSDIRDSDTLARLRTLGIKTFIGHRPENIDNAHVVVVSSAVSDGNPEMAAARAKGIPVIPRAEMLAELGRLKYGILVAGSHGKTTTTSLVATILGHAGLDPTIVIGGKLRAIGSNAMLGQGNFIVAEADESDGSFLKLSPTIAVITNIDREHMDFFKDMEKLRDAFVSFVNKVPFYGLSILCIDNENIREALPLVHRKHITYGFSKDADIRPENIRKGFLSIGFDVVYQGKRLGEFHAPIPGTHNVLNCLAAIAVAVELKVDIEGIKNALKAFSGIQRRFEFKGEKMGIKFFDDYGHHPAEVRATIGAAKESLASLDGKRRLTVLFQPHRYTRTRDLADEFASSFSDADVLYLTDIYPAGEKPIQGVSSEDLCRRIKNRGHKDVTYIPDRERLLDAILSRMRPGDIFFTLGAGDVWKAGEELLNRMNNG